MTEGGKGHLQTVDISCPGGNSGNTLASTMRSALMLPSTRPWESTTAVGSEGLPILPDKRELSRGLGGVGF